MRLSSRATSACLATVASAASLADVCTVSNVQASLPANGTLLGINLLPETVNATAVYNACVGMGGMGGSTGGGVTHNYCNVSWSITHTGRVTSSR